MKGCLLTVYCRYFTVLERYRTVHTFICDLYMCIPCQGHHGSPVTIQGITDRSARGCACVPVCVGMREYPFFVESALWLLTDCCIFGHQVICNYTVHPAGETNDFVMQSWCQCLINYEDLCINSSPKARMQWFVKKVQSDVSQNC